MRLCRNARRSLPAADELAVMADAQRRARAKIKDRLGAVGLTLRVAPREHVEPRIERERLVLVISEILKGQIFYLHNPRKTRRKYFLFLRFCIIIISNNF